MPALQLLRLVIQNNMCYGFGIMGSNEKTISFRAVAEKIEALDSLATAQERPRSYLINEAITNYIELHAYQDALVCKGLEEKRKGRVLSHEEVVKRLKRTGRVAPVIKWTEQATRQLDQAHDYIALSNSEDGCRPDHKQIVTAVQRLAVYPMSGKSWPGSW